MALSHNQSTAPFGAETIHRAISAIEVFFEGFAHRSKQRRTAKLLASLSNAQLEDIGLTRVDIDQIARG